MLVIGASGCGKSSLLRAGLAPDFCVPQWFARIARGRYAIMRPGGGDPIGSLVRALTADNCLPNLKSRIGGGEAELRHLLRTDAASATRLIRAELETSLLAGTPLVRGDRIGLLVIVDQLEEVFQPSLSDGERATFLRMLGELSRSCNAAAEGVTQVLVACSMRSDLLGHLWKSDDFAELADADAHFLLRPPDRNAIEEIVRGPAKEAGLSFEVDPQTGRDLALEIVDAAARCQDSLPLLSFVLDQLWQRCSSDGVLTFAAYEQLGGLEGALANRAEAVYCQLSDQERAALAPLIGQLVRIGDPRRGMEQSVESRLAPMSAFPEGSAERSLIEKLSAPAARLLALDGDHESAQVHVAHEALLTHWPRAQQQIELDRLDILVRQRVEWAWGQWEVAVPAERADRLLAPGAPLREAESLLRRRPGFLDDAMAAFVVRSAEHRTEAEFRTQQLVAESKREVQSARTLQIAAESRNRELAGASAAGAALDACRHLDRRVLEAELEVLKSIGHDHRFEARLARAWSDPTIRDIASVPGTDEFIELSVSADGRLAAVTRRDSSIQLIDVPSGAFIGHPIGPGDSGASGFDSRIALSPCGRFLASAHLRAFVLWETTTRTVIDVQRLEASVTSLAFHPKSTAIAIGCSDGGLRVWDRLARATQFYSRIHRDEVCCLTFSLDGNTLVTGGRDKTIQVLSTSTWLTLSEPKRCSSSVWAVGASADGRLLAAGTQDQLLVWQVGEQEPSHQFTSFGVSRVMPIHGGRYILSASQAGFLEFWDLRAGRRLGRPFPVPRAQINTTATAPDLSVLITTCRDSVVRDWDPVLMLLDAKSATDRGGNVEELCFSKDSRSLATICPEGKIQIWDAATGIPVISRTFSDRLGQAATSFDDSGSQLRLVGVRGKIASLDSTTLRPSRSMTIDAKAPSRRSRRWTICASGAVAAVRTDLESVQVIDTRTGRLTCEFPCGDAPGFRNLALSDGGDFVAVSESDPPEAAFKSKRYVIRVMSALTGEQRGEVLQGSGEVIESICVSADGTMVACGSWNNHIHLWHVSEDPRNPRLLSGHRDHVVDLAFSPDGKTLASTSLDGTVRLWSATTGRPIGEALDSDIDRPERIAFSPDGTVLAVAGAGGLRLLHASSQRERHDYCREVLESMNGAAARLKRRPEMNSADPIDLYAMLDSMLADCGESETARRGLLMAFERMCRSGRESDIAEAGDA